MPIKVQGGKEYKLVSERLVALREKWADADIQTEVEVFSNHAIIRAYIVAHHGEGSGKVATGHACVPLTGDKALEKGETTAVGRALAFLDPDLMGSEIASADEMQDFNADNVKKQLHKDFTNHMQAVIRNWDQVEYIKMHLLEEKLPLALEMWREIGEEDMKLLWRAPSKGGVFSTKERSLLDQASTEDFQARKANEL